MPNALELGQFFLEYQPIVHLPTGEIRAIESLLRWQHCEHGRLEAAEFIDQAEQTGFIDSLTTFVLTRAVQEWSGDSTAPAFNLAINLSPRTLHAPGLTTHVREILDTFQMSPSRFTIEITETQSFVDIVSAVASLTRLHDMGVRVVVDDFGRGFSSLSHLRQLPVDELKIDKAFIGALPVREDRVIVESTIALAHNLGLTVVAEGVETEEVRDHLLELGCDCAQGYLFSRAIPPRDLQDWMRQRIAYPSQGRWTS
jgi:EAL domain-containing protein (putative c-di-GMP-specific phosphodiesterase class I)